MLAAEHDLLACLQERFGHNFVGQMWNEAQQNEPPFEVIQRLHPEVPLPDVLAEFASRCAGWDFGPGLAPKLRSLAGDENGWQRYNAVTKRSDGQWTSASSNLCWLGEPFCMPPCLFATPPPPPPRREGRNHTLAHMPKHMHTHAGAEGMASRTRAQVL